MGNFTRVKSEADVSGFGVGTTPRRPLEGQSDYVVNAGIYYASDKGGTSAALLYNVFGRRLARVGVYGLPDIYEQPRNSVDMTLGQRFGGSRIGSRLENILNDDVRFEQKQPYIPGVVAAGSRVTHTAHRGRSFSISISSGD